MVRTDAFRLARHRSRAGRSGRKLRRVRRAVPSEVGAGSGWCFSAVVKWCKEGRAHRRERPSARCLVSLWCRPFRRALVTSVPSGVWDRDRRPRSAERFPRPCGPPPVSVNHAAKAAQVSDSVRQFDAALLPRTVRQWPGASRTRG